MTSEEINKVIEETAVEYNWTLDEAINHLNAIGFSIENVINNPKFTKSHMMMSVDFAYNAIK